MTTQTLPSHNKSLMTSCRLSLAAVKILLLSFCLTIVLSSTAGAQSLGQIEFRKLAASRDLFYALAHNDLEQFSILLDQGAAPNCSLDLLGLSATEIFGPDQEEQKLRRESWPLLSWAAYLGQEEAIKLLFKAGVRLDSLDEYGASALFWAAWAGHLEVAQTLLSYGASCQVYDLKGRSPKDWAIMMGRAPLIKLFSTRSCRSPIIEDDDRDGVANAADLCPQTPQGATWIDDTGCWLAALGYFFELDEAKIRPEYEAYLAVIYNALQREPQQTIKLAVYCPMEPTVQKEKDLLAKAQALSKYWQAKGWAAEKIQITGPYVEKNLVPFISKGSFVIRLMAE